MEDKKKIFEMVDELRADCAIKQKMGLHFIITSVIIWTAMLIIQMTSLNIVYKNFLTLCCSAPLMPIALLISKIIKVDFQNKDNPLTNLGIVFSVNQIVYILIAMWVLSAQPEKMLMVYTMIFGAHLMPYGWLYKTKTYIIFSVFIPIAALMIGLRYSSVVLAVFMVIVEIIFCVCLIICNKKMVRV